MRDSEENQRKKQVYTGVGWRKKHSRVSYRLRFPLFGTHAHLNLYTLCIDREFRILYIYECIMAPFTTHKEGINPQRLYKYVRLLKPPTKAGRKHSPGSLYFLPLGYFHRQGR